MIRVYPLYIVLAVCPMLTITGDLRLASWMGVIFLVTVCCTSIFISAVRDLISPNLRIPVILLVSATVVSAVSLGLQYLVYDVFADLGIYVSLLAMNCLVIALAEEVALRQSPLRTVIKVVWTAISVSLVLIFIGITRQYAGLALLSGPTGGFLLLGLLLAGTNYLHAVKTSLRESGD